MSGFTSQTTQYPSVCQADFYQGICNDGSISYTHTPATQSCTAGMVANCTVNGQVVGQGAFNIASGYTTSTTTYPNSCHADSYQGTCDNGRVTFTHSPAAQTCTAGAPANCTVNGRSVGQGGFNIPGGFTSSTTNYPLICQTDFYQGTCNNGSVSYAHTPATQSCTAGIAANCTVNGKTVGQGSFNIAGGYTTATTDYPVTCQADSYQGTCSNGSVTYSHSPAANSCASGSPHAPRFKVVQEFGQGLFYDTQTKSIFRPRGVNYVHLNTVEYVGWHDTFDPRYYSAANAEAALTGMANQGYNIVRITLDNPWNTLNLAGYSGRRLDPQYVAAVVDFLQRARNHGLLVNMAQAGVPGNYTAYASNEMLYPEKIQARANYLWDLIVSIPADLRDQIFSIDVFNEAYFVTAVFWNGANIGIPPFDGSVSTFNYAGTNYNMTTPSGRQQLMDTAAYNSYQTLVATVKGAAPQILVTASLFTPASSGRPSYDGLSSYDSNMANKAAWFSGNPTAPLPVKASIAIKSNLDYLDLHLYQWLGPSRDVQFFYDQMHSADLWENSVVPKPIVLSEFGLTYDAYPDHSNTSLLNSTLQQVMQASAKDFGFSGWIYYEWNDLTNGVWTIVDGANNLLLGGISQNSLPQVYALPAGNFLAYGGIFASSGGHYCYYDTWERYLSLGGIPDVSSFPTYSRIPATMIYDGVCGVWEKPNY